MAIIHEEILIIKVSKLVKDTADTPSLINADTIAALEQVAQELVGDGVIVEVDEAK
jgi:hypothetical protein